MTQGEAIVRRTEVTVGKVVAILRCSLCEEPLGLVQCEDCAALFKAGDDVRCIVRHREVDRGGGFVEAYVEPAHAHVECPRCPR